MFDVICDDVESWRGMMDVKEDFFLLGDRVVLLVMM